MSGNSFLKSFAEGADLGHAFKRREEEGEVNKLLGEKKYKEAQERSLGHGHIARTQEIQKALAGMGDGAKEAAQERSQWMAQAAYALTRVPPQQRKPMAIEWMKMRGFDPSPVQQMNDFSDQTLMAFAQSEMELSDQLAQFSTDTTNLGDQVIGTRTDNFTGNISAQSAITRDKTFGESHDENVLSETIRSNKAGEVDKDFSNRTARMNADTSAAKQKAGGSNEIILADGTVIRTTSGEQDDVDKFFEMRGVNQSIEITDAIVSDNIDRALEQADIWTTGFMSLASAVYGTPAHDLKATLETIEANIGFDKLQDMRNNSPTGGALGQVSNLEIQLLQSVMGSIRQSQNGEQLRFNLRRLKEVKGIAKKNRDQALALRFDGKLPYTISVDDYLSGRINQSGDSSSGGNFVEGEDGVLIWKP